MHRDNVKCNTGLLTFACIEVGYDWMRVRSIIKQDEMKTMLSEEDFKFLTDKYQECRHPVPGLEEPAPTADAPVVIPIDTHLLVDTMVDLICRPPADAEPASLEDIATTIFNKLRRD
jgi:hypothetical protein